MVAYFVRTWRLLNGIIALIPLFLVPFYVSAPESLAFLIGQRKWDQFRKTLLLVAEKSQTAKIDFQILNQMVDNLEKSADISSLDSIKNNSAKSKNVSLITLFTSGREIASLTFKIITIWGSIALVYNGIALDTSFLPFSTYLVVFLYGVLDMIANFVFPWLMNRYGRRYTTVYGLLIAGVCCILVSVLTPYLPCQHLVETRKVSLVYSQLLKMIILVSGLLGRGIIAGVYCLVYTYTGELYPTAVRASGVSIGMYGAGLYSIIGVPLVMYFKKYYVGLPGIVFGIFSFVSAGISWALPETLGVGILNNLEEAKNFLTHKKTGLGISTPEKTDFIYNK